MRAKDRDEIERLLIKTGAKHWPRIERIVLKFSELEPAVDGPAGDDASPAPQPQSAPAPAPQPQAAPPGSAQERELRAQANRALGR